MTRAIQQTSAGGVTTPSASPDPGPHLVAGTAVNGERSESAGREAPLTAGTETKQSQPGEAENQPPVGRTMIMEKLLLSPTEAAAHLSVGRSKVYELMRLGLLRSVKIGGCRRIPRSALAEFVSSLEAVS